MGAKDIVETKPTPDLPSSYRLTSRIFIIEKMVGQKNLHIFSQLLQSKKKTNTLQSDAGDIANHLIAEAYFPTMYCQDRFVGKQRLLSVSENWRIVQGCALFNDSGFAVQDLLSLVAFSGSNLLFDGLREKCKIIIMESKQYEHKV
jgi:hypothetical protein